MIVFFGFKRCTEKMLDGKLGQSCGSKRFYCPIKIESSDSYLPKCLTYKGTMPPLCYQIFLWYTHPLPLKFVCNNYKNLDFIPIASLLLWMSRYAPIFNYDENRLIYQNHHLNKRTLKWDTYFSFQNNSLD